MFLLPKLSDNLAKSEIPTRLKSMYILNIQPIDCGSILMVVSIEGIAGPTIEMSSAPIRTPTKSTGMIRRLGFSAVI